MTLERGGTGAIRHWSNLTLEQFDTGARGHWSEGALEQWDTGARGAIKWYSGGNIIGHSDIIQNEVDVF